ncbi:MAG: DUF1987 domain-containing protein [Bacteroidales bacterium]
MGNQNQKAIVKKLENSIGRDKVHIKGTIKTPDIYLNKNEGVIKLKGRSIPENAKELYYPIIEWTENYIKSSSSKTNLIFQLEYFNTASSKMIFELINTLKITLDQGKKLNIEWHYMEDDDDILDSGETFQEISGLDFNFYSYE